MPSISVTTRDGTSREVDAAVGISVMEVIRDAGIDELQAICGGCCSCSTCHVYVDSDQLQLLPPIHADEDDLLDSSNYREAESRLSCQVPFTAALDGLRVTIAPED